MDSFNPDDGKGIAKVPRITDEDIVRNFHLVNIGGKELISFVEKQLNYFVAIYNLYISRSEREKAENFKARIVTMIDEVLKKTSMLDDVNQIRAILKLAVAKLNSAPRLKMIAAPLGTGAGYELNFIPGVPRYEKTDHELPGGKVAAHFHD